MPIDYRIVDGPSGGLTFDFIPCDHAFSGEYDFDRNGPDVFSVSENAYLFIEKAIAETWPPYRSGHRYGVSWLAAEMWPHILSRLEPLKFDVRRGADLETIHRKHVLYPTMFGERHRLHRAALLRFLAELEERVRIRIARYPYLIIGGI